MPLPSELPTATPERPSLFQGKRWVWPTMVGALIGIGLRLVFRGHPHAPYNPMMASFALIAPVVIGAVSVVTAERTARRSWSFYFWGAASANALCAAVAFLVDIEGLICIILAAPLFVLLGGIAGLVTGMVCRLTQSRRGIYGIALLPLILGGFEQRLPLPQTVLREERVLVIEAPTTVVWQQLLSARDIQPEEMNQAWMYRIGVPLPRSAVTETQSGTLIRHITMGKSIQFDQVSADWIANQRVLWTYRFTADSFPPHALDDHVRIGGTYFDVLDTEYRLREVPSGTELSVSMRYRVSTNFNWYVRPIAAFLVGDFETTALHFYARRAEQARERMEPSLAAMD
jgi:hypothetical protein